MKKPQSTANIRTPTGMVLARRSLGLSAMKFAKLLGMKSDRQIYNYESGAVPIPSTIALLTVYILKERGLWPVRAPIPLARVPSSETSHDQP